MSLKRWVPISVVLLLVLSLVVPGTAFGKTYWYERYLRAVDLTHVQTSKEADKLHAVTVGMGRKPRVVVAPNGIKEELLALPSRGTPEKRLLYMTHLAGGRASESRWFVDRKSSLLLTSCSRSPSLVMS